MQRVSQKSPLKILWVSNETKFDDVMALTKLVDIFNELMRINASRNVSSQNA